MKLTYAFAVVLATSSVLVAQTANSSTTVVYTQPSTVDTFVAANPGASLHQATADGLTFRLANGTYRFTSARGITYQQNGQWVPTQIQVANRSDGSGWVLGGVGYSAQLAKGATADKELSISSGSSALSIHVPGLNYNGDDTFAFSEGATNWLLRVTGYGITMRARMPFRIGAVQHSFKFETAGAPQVQNTAYGDLALGSAIHLTRAVLLGADNKTYAVCSPWNFSGGAISFTCDDSKLPNAAIPYIIDPILSTGPNWTDGGSVHPSATSNRISMATSTRPPMAGGTQPSTSAVFPRMRTSPA